MEELTGLLEGLAEKLGTTTEYLWGVMINQAPIDAAIGIGLIVLCMLLYIPIIWYVKWVSKNWKNKIYDEDSEIAHMFLSIIFGILIIIFTTFNIRNIDNIFTALYNPEYWALNKVLGMF